MTVIVAVSDGKRVCMACDSQMGNGGTKVVGGSKIHRCHGILLGADGTLAIGQFFMHYYNPTEDFAHLSDLALDFCHQLRPHLEKHNAMRKYNDQWEFPGQILIARGPEWLLIDSGGNIVPHTLPWWAIGSGGSEARGAIATANTLHPLDRVSDVSEVARLAVSASCLLDDGCSPPIHVEWTTPVE